MRTFVSKLYLLQKSIDKKEGEIVHASTNIYYISPKKYKSYFNIYITNNLLSTAITLRVTALSLFHLTNKKVNIFKIFKECNPARGATVE